MIYSIVGTQQKIRNKAREEVISLGDISRYIYQEEAGELESHIDATSLFGSTVIISCVQLSGNSSSKEILVSLLPKMKDSANIFIIDEPFADTYLSTTLRKASDKFFDAKEEKMKDTSVFVLCDYFVARDKKNTWKHFIDIREKESGEAIAGALWWKFQGLWSRVREGKKTPFTLADCDHIGGELVRATMRAHRGERDLMTELERIILLL